MTFREKPITKLYAFAMAAVFALVLAGCGGGGGSAAVEEEPPVVVEPEPTPQEMCEADNGRYNDDGTCTSAEELAAEMAEAEALSGAQDAAMAAYMAAMAAVSGAKDPVAMGNAQPYAGMAKEASDMAAAATTSEMAMEYQMKAEMYRDMAMKAGMTRGLGLTTLANKITNQADIDNAILEGTEPDDPVSNATRVGAALALSAAADADPTTTAGSVHQGGTASATATYGASGPSMTVDLTAVTGANPVTRGENPQGLTTRGGWMGAELVGGATGATNSMTYANAYTDVQPDKVTPNYEADVTLTPGTGVLTGDIPGDGSSFEGTYNASTTDNTPAVPGRYHCPTGAAGVCSISADDKGNIVSVVGYVFQPLDSSTGTKTPDTDYLAWGVWLHVPNATEATNLAVAGAFASGNDVFEVRAELKGTATYNGVATGMYSAAGMVEYFDADVSLMANFGGTVGADSDTTTDVTNDGFLLGAVTGSVSNIRAGGMDVAGSLTLKRAPIVTTTANGDSSNGFTGDTSGTLASRAMAGEWGGQFYGPNKATADTAAAQTEFPTTAAGTFGADSDGVGTDKVRILGSFGTWKAE